MEVAIQNHPILRPWLQKLSSKMAVFKKARKTKGVFSETYWTTLREINRMSSPNQTLGPLTRDEYKDIGLYYIAENMPEIIIEDLKTIKSVYKNDPDQILNGENWKSYYFIMLATMNHTDLLINYTKALVRLGLVEILKFFITELNSIYNIDKDNTPPYYKVLKISIEMFVNVSRAVPAHELRDNGIVDFLIPFVKSEDQNFAVASFVALAAIVDEEQNDLLMANPEPIKRIINLLDTSLSCPNHRLEKGTQWASYELGDALIQIAVNDKNKIQIVKQGGLPVLAKFLKNAKVRGEVVSAARCFWMLAFNKDNIDQIKKRPVSVKRLWALKKSPFHDISTAVSGALWEIEQKEKRSQTTPSSDIANPTATDNDQPHIMISYQLDVQDTLIEVKVRLKQNGYKVYMWMDMRESPLEAMTKAVENSAVVLMCISSKYKESPNCRSEAEYAYQLKKDIIPLMMEENFKPDGWLGIIVGTKLWYDYRQSARIPDSMDKLFKELSTRQLNIGASSSLTQQTSQKLTLAESSKNVSE